MVIETGMTEECRLYGMIIPFSLVRTGEKVVIHAFPWARMLAEQVDALAEKKPEWLFSDAFYAYVNERLRLLAEERGYLPDEGYCGQFSRVFRLEEASALRREVILPETARIRWNDGFVCRTETELDENYRDCPLFGVVRNGELLSFANVNHDDGEVADIGVETAPEAEGMGLASSNVAALAAFLLEQGRSVTYIALSDNPGSMRVAEKAGFSLHALEYNYVCFLEEDETV